MRRACSTRIRCETRFAVSPVRVCVALSACFLAACGSSAHAPERAAAHDDAIGTYLTAFQRNPDEANWLRLHDALLSGAATVSIESSIVATLAQRDVARNVFDAAVVDVAALNWAAAMRTARNANVAARRGSSSAAAAAVARTSSLVWRIAGLRSIYAVDTVNLTATDLRNDPPPPGMPLNLTGFDFSHSMLSGMHWKQTNVTDARFHATSVAGTLSCTGCSFGNVRYGGTAVLQDGTWRRR